MNEEMTDPLQSPKDRPDPSGHVKVDVTVCFPAEQDVIYVKTGKEWVRYERSGRCSDTCAGIPRGMNGLQEKTAQEGALEIKDLHWAGHGAGRCQELMPAHKHRVYYDPRERPDLFIIKDGEPPTRPLPALDLDDHLQDPEPWLDPASGTRFTCDQARITTTLLKYAPREEKPVSSSSRESGVTPSSNRRTTFATPRKREKASTGR